MTFPQKTKWLKSPIGWEDLGEQEKLNVIENNESISRQLKHGLCHTVVHIGKEDDNLFLFCHKCLVKIKQSRQRSKR